MTAPVPVPVPLSVIAQPFRPFTVITRLEADILELNPETPIALCVTTSLDLSYGIEPSFERKFSLESRCPEHMRSLGSVVVASYPNRAPIYLLFTKNVSQAWPPVETLRQVFFKLKQALAVKNPPMVVFPPWPQQSGLWDSDPAIVHTIIEATFATSPTSVVVAVPKPR